MERVWQKMMKCLKDKLKGKSGASLAATLLLFLVCAVIGSAVLTAASATSGRIAERRESDRRYYAVTSAAKLFASQMTDYTVVINEKASITETETLEEYTEAFSFDSSSLTIKTIDEENNSDVVLLSGITVSEDMGNPTYSYNTDVSNCKSLLEDVVLTMYVAPNVSKLQSSEVDDEGKIELWGDKYKNGTIYSEFPAKDFTITSSSTIDVYGRISGTQSGAVEAIFSNEPIPNFSTGPQAVEKDAYLVTVICEPSIVADIETTYEPPNTNDETETTVTTRKETKGIRVKYTSTIKETR